VNAVLGVALCVVEEAVLAGGFLYLYQRSLASFFYQIVVGSKL
jgi:hypothetical protein